MNKIFQRLHPSVEEKHGLLFSFLAILMVGAFHSFGARQAGFFTAYNFAIVMAAYLAGRRRGLTSASLSLFVLVLLIDYEPRVFYFYGEEGASAFRWAAMVAWIGFLLLAASFLVTLREKKIVPKPEPKSRPFERSLASLPYDLLQTSFTTAEKFVKRLMPRPSAVAPVRSPFGS